MPYLKDAEITELRSYLQAILEVKNIDDAHRIAGRALEFLEKFAKKNNKKEV